MSSIELDNSVETGGVVILLLFPYKTVSFVSSWKQSESTCASFCKPEIRGKKSKCEMEEKCAVWGERFFHYLATSVPPYDFTFSLTHKFNRTNIV